MRNHPRRPGLDQHVRKAVATRQEHTARSLGAMAGAKAKKLEAATLALNTAKWKNAIGATSREGR